MMIIIDDIRRCTFEYEMSTGLKPTRIYLGFKQLEQLREITFQCHYAGTIDFILGLKIYEVYDEDHMRVCN